ncbi:MAG: sigma-70 family RNA polymerase sigma factor, partial [Thermoleophilia bacterium]|nr:sigma-70 family RNA polymerase sigma factor [Thermoleophilia bacterium]
PLLTREQEAHLFRQMNCLKAQAERIRREAVAGRPSTAALASARERIEALLERAAEVRSHILRANQRLVVSIAKRFAGRTGDLFEMISDANLPLIEAVERFDFSRGYRFSTYATWAIRNGLIRSVAVERRRRERYLHGVDEIFDAVADYRGESGEAQPLPKNPAASVRALLARLNDRERLVLEGRYGLDGARQKSLRQIGTQIGVSKERARQIEIAAREKLRRFAAGLSLGPIPA